MHVDIVISNIFYLNKHFFFFLFSFSFHGLVHQYSTVCQLTHGLVHQYSTVCQLTHGLVYQYSTLCQLTHGLVHKFRNPEHVCWCLDEKGI